jgi:PBSX family phage portal protein
MSMSDKTRQRIGLEQKGTDTDNALGVISTVIKSDDRQLSKAEKMMVESKALTIEDDPWAKLPKERKGQIITPTYDPVVLSGLVYQNNTLAPLVDAMEINVDGTGYDFERRDGKPKSDEEKKQEIGYMFDFFDNVYPGKSFITVRRELRRDLETTGNAYMEVIRDNTGSITLLGRLEANLTRVVRLDDPVAVDKTLTRNGKQVTVRLYTRERRFVQIVGSQVRYFREYDSSRHLNALTGEWIDEVPKKAPPPTVKPAKAKPGDKPENVTDKVGSIPTGVEKREGKPDKVGADGTPVEFANEVIWFRLKPDIVTPYGVPRWVNNVPSVLGSREAEELNLEYFRHGGLPPVIMFILGGQLTSGSRDQLNKYLGGAAKSKVRGVISEVFSTAGDLSSAGNVKVMVERFGSDRQADALFENYDDKCASRVRASFRLPPLFTGHANDYSFATAYASYLTSEAQVFKPERLGFDEIINATVMQELAPEYFFRSLPLTVHDVNVQLSALGLVKDFTNKEEFVDEVNEIAGLNLTFEEPPPPMLPPGMEGGSPGQEPAQQEYGQFDVPPPGEARTPGQPPKPQVAKAEGDGFLVNLATDWTDFLTGAKAFEDSSVRIMKRTIESFNPTTRKLFNAYVGLRMVPHAQYDPDGVADLLACAGDAAAAKQFDPPASEGAAGS